MTHDDATYIRTDMFFGEEAELSLRTVKLVKARKEHDCYFSVSPYGQKHTIKPGDRYRHERALVDGDFFGSYRVCLPCLDKFIAGDY